MLAALVAGVLAPRARAAGRTGRLLAEFYPLLLTLALYTHLRPLGAVFVPLALLLSLGTVYGHWHYAVDALAGAAVGLCVDGLGRRAGYDSAPV